MKLGIDIGGTNIRIGLVSDCGKVVKAETVASFGRDASLDETLVALKETIRAYLSDDVESIGIGVPSALDYREGIVYNAVNIPCWQNVPLKQILEDEFDIPVYLNNDSNCFALGTYAMLKGDKPASLAAITLGTGVGMGLVIDGHLYSGNNTGAGEIGCISYLDADAESYCSSGFFSRLGTTCKDVAEAYERGDESAREVMEEFGRHMGFLISTVIYTYDPQVLVLGGGISRAFPYFKQSISGYLAEHFIYPESLEKLTILQMSDDDIAVVGAANLKD